MAKVLVIDDEPGMRRILSVNLQRDAHVVVEAAGVSEAINLLRREDFDVVLTDIFMDGKEGIETIAMLKKKWPHVRVIAMSGGGDVATGSYLAAARQVGVDATLVKPFSIEDLKGVVISEI